MVPELAVLEYDNEVEYRSRQRIQQILVSLTRY